jgi:hypothetical protein
MNQEHGKNIISVEGDIIISKIIGAADQKLKLTTMEKSYRLLIILTND